MSAQQINQTHVFENAGMGKAPFKLVGFYAIPSKSLAEHNPTAYNNMLAAMPKGVGCGTCVYCGTALINNFIIESSDGKKSAVGCDCVAKTGDQGLTDTIKLKKLELAREKRALARQAKWQAQEDKRQAELEEERTRNGGLTDSQVYQQKVDALEAEFGLAAKTISENLGELLNALDPKKDSSSFVRDMISLIERGQLNDLSRNMWNIVADIAAKQTGGRANSKAYNTDRARYDDMINNAKEQFTEKLEILKKKKAVL